MTNPVKIASLVIAGFALVLFSGPSWADVSLVVSPRKSANVLDLKQLLTHPRVMHDEEESESVFSATEKAALKEMGQEALGETLLIKVRSKDDALALKEWSIKKGLNLVIEENSLRLSTFDEPLEHLQWGITNTGVAQQTEVADLVTVSLRANKGEDINLGKLPLKDLSNKKIRVAVLDTGIDLEHPNLKSQIVHDKAECEAVEKYKNCLKTQDEAKCDAIWATVDANRNGYPLDCSGWDVTAGFNRTTGIFGSNNPSDDTGHGTHVAGIIAAAANGTGIRGVAQNVEILPIKVIRSSPNAPVRPQGVSRSLKLVGLPPTLEKKLKWNVAFANIIARGVLYAIRSNAQIMNLSLGWPARVDSTMIRKMVELAQSRGILVVASAGNDSSDARIMPCQYDGVICVASHNPDGSLSHFSNYGSFVDLAAPGMQILSTWPVDRPSDRFTARSGYDYKSGTSMAAPFVSGALARLLSAGIPFHEAYPRLVAGSRLVQHSQGKYLRSGNLDLSRSFQMAVEPLILPARKLPVQLSWDRKNVEIPFNFSLKNVWGFGKNIRVQAEIQQKIPVQMGHLKTSQWDIQSWAGGVVEDFKTCLVIDERGIDGRLLLSVTVETDGTKREFKIPIEIAVPVTPSFSDPEVETVFISGELFKNKVSLRSVTSMDSKAGQDYVAIQESPSGLKLQLIEQQGSQYKVSLPQIISPIEGDLLVLQRIDRNQDGRRTYVFVYRLPSRSQTELPSFRFLFFDENIRLQESIDYNNKISIISERFQWLRVEDSHGLGLAPSWVGFGLTPPSEKQPYDPWNPDPPDVKQLNLYYLASNGLHTVAVPEPYSVVQVLAQSLEDVAKGKVSIILSQGNDYKLKYFTADVARGKIEAIRPLSLPSFRMLLGMENILEITSLDPSIDFLGTAFAGETARGSIQTTFISQPVSGTDRFSILDGKQGSPSQFDPLVTISGAYLGKQMQATFAQTHYQLEYKDLSSGEMAFTDLDRFSFLPAFVFSRTFFPIVVSSSPGGGFRQERLPGLLIPASLGVSKTLEVVLPVYHPDNHKLLGLSHPARLRLVAGEGCVSLGNVIRANSLSPTQMVFFCGDRFIRIPASI